MAAVLWRWLESLVECILVSRCGERFFSCQCVHRPFKAQISSRVRPCAHFTAAVSYIIISATGIVCHAAYYDLAKAALLASDASAPGMMDLTTLRLRGLASD